LQDHAFSANIALNFLGFLGPLSGLALFCGLWIDIHAAPTNFLLAPIVTAAAVGSRNT